MPGLDIFLRWIDALIEIGERLREARRGGRTLLVRRDGARFVARPAEAGAGTEAPVEAARGRSAEFVVLEWPRERLVARSFALPVEAREFMRGVVDNRLDRLSPWPVAQIVHGAISAPGGRPGELEVSVLIAARAEVEAAQAELAALGVVVDRVVAAPARPNAPTIVLWSREERRAGVELTRARRLVGGGVLAYVALCAALGLWAAGSATALSSDSEELAARARTLQKSARGAGAKAIAALDPPERAWARKETAVAAIELLEALSRSLPDGAYLTELQWEADKLRLVGLAADAPPLIGALEASGRLADVRFFAPTTLGPDRKLFHFSIEARVIGRAPAGGG